MAKHHTFISEKEIIGTRQFLEVYLGVIYNKEKRLTHAEMKEFLMSKAIEMPNTVSYDQVDKLTLSNGTYIAVRDESKKKKKGRLVIYENPLTNSFGKLLNELNSKKDYNKLKQIRENILSEFNLEEDYFGEIVTKEPEVEVTVKINRQKVKKKEMQTHSKGRRI